MYRLRHRVVARQSEVLIIDRARTHPAVQRGRVPRVRLHYFRCQMTVVFKLLLLKVVRLPPRLHRVNVRLEYSLLCLVTLVVRQTRRNLFFLHHRSWVFVGKWRKSWRLTHLHNVQASISTVLHFQVLLVSDRARVL